ANILNQVLNPVHASRVPASLFGLLDTAQVEARAPPRFLWCHPFCDVFLGYSFEVVAQLVVQFLVRLRPAKQRPQPQRNRVQPMLRSHSPALPHSYLRATMGSTREARRAGRNAARSAIATKEMVAPINSEMSVGLMP